MKKTLEGKIARISVNHEKEFVTFILEGSPTVYRLKEGSLGNPNRNQTPAIELAAAGDEVVIDYWECESRYSNGEVARWTNKTMDMACGCPDSL